MTGGGNGKALKVRTAERLDPERTAFLIILITSIIKMFFALKGIFCITDHDIQLIDINTMKLGDTGHPGYINYLIEHMAFPPIIKEFTSYPPQFYHPPVFYIIGAVIKSIACALGASDMIAYEIIQQFNMLFSCLCVIVCHKIIRRIGIGGWTGTALITFIACNPIFLIIGAELNNDCLMTLFCLLAIYFTLCWHESRSTKDILLAALTLALGMLTKTSAVLIAPAMGLVFLYDLVNDIRQKKLGEKKTIPRFILFGIVSIPLGLSWVLRNLIVYKVPFSYVPRLPGGTWQYTGDIPLVSRLLVPSIRQFTTCSTDLSDTAHFNNIFGQSMQSMLFDEGILYEPDPVTPIVMMWLMTALVILMAVLFVCFLFSSKEALHLRLMLGGAVIVPVISFIVFYLQYPYICTVHVRYIVTSVVCLAVGAAAFVRHREKCSKIFVLLCFAASFAATFDYILY